MVVRISGGIFSEVLNVEIQIQDGHFEDYSRSGIFKTSIRFNLINKRQESILLLFLKLINNFPVLSYLKQLNETIKNHSNSIDVQLSSQSFPGFSFS
jgi:hypothetical protein